MPAERFTAAWVVESLPVTSDRPLYGLRPWRVGLARPSDSETEPDPDGDRNAR